MIGRELSKRAAEYGPLRLLLIEYDVNGVVKTQNELIENYPYLSHEVALTDRTYTIEMEDILREHEPQILFHTDSLKYLRFTERQPLKAVEINFLAIKKLAEMVDEIGMERFIFISTMKAAYPTNCLSISHKMAEFHLEEFVKRSRTRFTSVRVGNVLGEEAFLVKLLYLKGRLPKGGKLPFLLRIRGFTFSQ